MSETAKVIFSDKLYFVSYLKTPNSSIMSELSVKMVLSYARSVLLVVVSQESFMSQM